MGRTRDVWRYPGNPDLTGTMIVTEKGPKIIWYSKSQGTFSEPRPLMEILDATIEARKEIMGNGPMTNLERQLGTAIEQVEAQSSGSKERK